MTKEQIDRLIGEGEFPEPAGRPELIETHISWVVLCEGFVYKIKKPIHYSFLDFSTLNKRKYYCEKEVELNKRLTENIYLDVQPVTEKAGRFSIGNKAGEIIDYAVRMLKVDRSRQMDLLLLADKVTPGDMMALAKKIAAFHKKAPIIYHKELTDIQNKFNDLHEESDFLKQFLPTGCDTISHAIKTSDSFLQKNSALLVSRQKNGFTRDCHGDLHSRNIFLLPEPQPFDCIEFNDDYRQIDVLNEIAFLCMDLDAFGRQALSGLFLSYYNDFFPAMRTKEENDLFIYYKSYRANIRAKVNSLRLRSAGNDKERNLCLAEADKYLTLMDHYLNLLPV